MDFSATQQFDASAVEVFETFRSARLVGALEQFGPLSQPELLGSSTERDRTIVSLRYHYVGDLPAAALAVVERSKLSWVEETTYDPSTLRATVRLLPDHYSDKLQATAMVTFDNVGTGSTRIIAGTLKVRVPLVGRQVERAIVGGLESFLALEADHVAAYLATA